MAVELAALLRAETQASHRKVESSVFMAALMGGRLEKPAYTLLLRNLEPIYFELEAGLLRHAAHAGIRPLFHTSLRRLKALHRDLEILHGQSWREELQLVAACSVYVARLQYLQNFAPELLVAHAYVRYLGDLSGGQQLAGIVVRSLGLPVHEGGNFGVDFYNFGQPDEVLQLSKAFRTGLDTLACDGIPAEAKLAFELHGDLFEELARRCGLVAPAVNASW